MGSKAPKSRALQPGAWEDLQFSVDEPHLYSYQYVPGATTFSVLAIGDLDCDGIPGSFTIAVRREGGELFRHGTFEYLPDE